ncbi:MAG: DUF192 domain-containing protein [Endomicrobiia bacterium]
MKKIFRKTIILFVLFLFGVFLYFNRLNFEIIEYEIEGKKYKLYLADTQKKREVGLMYKKKLDNVDGMLFIFDEKIKPVFYNKNTYLDLDIYWIDGSSVVFKSFLPSITTARKIVYVSSAVEVDKVIELIRKK